MLLQVNELKKLYGVNEVIKNASLSIRTGERVGLVGSNGVGKTTLLRCLVQEEQTDGGEIAWSEGVKIGYLEQIPELAPGVSLFAAVMESFADVLEIRNRLSELETEMGKTQGKDLEKIMKEYGQLSEEYERSGGFGCENMVRRVTGGLGFSEADLGREASSFSGGEKTRIGLARLLARTPELLLLDEPTNHLDIDSAEWLENYLKNYLGSLLIISHDRYFLDQICNKIIELENGKTMSFPGNFSRYLVLKEEMLQNQMREAEKQREKIEAAEAYIERFRAGIKAKQARGRQSQLNRLEKIEAPRKIKSISLTKAGKSATETGQTVLRLRQLSVSYDENNQYNKRLLDRIDLEIKKGEKIALIGKNGAGKTTLLKTILGQLTPQSGQVVWGARVKAGYFDQEHSGLDETKRVIEELTINYGLTEGEARNKLATFLFRGDDVFKSVGDLSGGEKGRLAFLKMVLEEPNFLILDEPTNHLDISASGVIERYLRDFPGSVLVISHDRYFLDAFTNRTMKLENGHLTGYAGNYSFYKEKEAQLLREKEERRINEQQVSVERKLKNKIKPAENRADKAKLKERLAQTESEISEMERRLEELAAILADAETYKKDEIKIAQFMTEYKNLEEEIPQAYQRWERLIAELEGFGVT